MFVSANANQFIRLVSFVGYLNNSFAEYFLRSQSKFLDYDILNSKQLPSFTSNTSSSDQKPSNDQQLLVGISTLSTCYLFMLKSIEMMIFLFILFGAFITAMHLKKYCRMKKSKFLNNAWI